MSLESAATLVGTPLFPYEKCDNLRTLNTQSKIMHKA